MVWLARCLLGLLCLGTLLLSWGVQAQTIQTVAGSGLGPEGAPATSIALNSPQATAMDSAGNLYIADRGNHRIRKVDTNGTITTVAGNGTWGFGGDNGPATSAQLNAPTGVALDSAGKLYIADTYNHRIRKLVPGAPGAPGTLSAVAGDGAATLSWTAPSNDGGSPITGYTVTASPASPASPGGTCTATPPSTTCTISGLTNGTAYTFTVVASNAVGSSAPSAPSSAVTPLAPGPQVPGAPTGVTALAGDGAATLSWTAPSDDGGSPITGYTVTASPASSGGTCSTTPPATSCTISGLTNAMPCHQR